MKTDHDNHRVSAKVHQETGGTARLSDPIVQLEVLRNMESLQDLRLDSSEQSIEPFTEKLATRLVRIHQALVKKGEVNVDLVHFEYRSLVVRASMSIDEGREIREVFAPTKPDPNGSALERFAKEVNYEPGRDILPKVDCNFCTLCLMPNEDRPSESLIERGIYPINASGIKVLGKILTDVKLHPWELGSRKKRAFAEFRASQGDLPAKWDQRHRSYRAKKILPDFAGIFDFALGSAIRTMLILSDDLFEMYANFPLCSDPQNCPPGQRRGGATRQQLERLRKRILAQLSDDSSKKVHSRALTFIPIRMPTSDGAKGYLETIGLVAYYSNEPIDMPLAAELAVIEHLIFLTCRQYEGFKLRNQIRDRVNALELQRIFARLIAHEAAKPLGNIKDFLDSLERTMRESRKSLGEFARGEFKALQRKRRVDLYDIMTELKSLRASRIDSLNVRYEEEVYSGNYVFADRDAVRYSLGVLLDNAIAHGKGLVRVWTENKADRPGHQRYVVVCVANNGAPMRPRLEEAINAGQPPIRPGTIGRIDKNQGVGLNLAFEFARLNKWKLLYRRVEGDPRDLRHVFQLWLPSAEVG